MAPSESSGVLRELVNRSLRPWGRLGGDSDSEVANLI
jgi:hypothetical protein